MSADQPRLSPNSRLVAELGKRGLEDLHAIQRLTEKDRTAVVRDSLKRNRFITEAVERGARVQVVEPDGRVAMMYLL